jgi:hypothetical protein
MKHDPFEFTGMTVADKLWRVLFLFITIAVLCADLFIWRP